MLQLIKRSPEYVNGYKAYCQEAFDNNLASSYVCEKLGGKLWDKIESFNKDEGHHLMRRYWIYL